MYYEIWVRKRGKQVICEENFLPGIIIPVEKEYLLKADMAEKVGICDGCLMAYHTHPIDEEGCKWCTVLLWDALRPESWKVEDAL